MVSFGPLVDSLSYVATTLGCFSSPWDYCDEIGWTWYGQKFRGSGLNKACKFALLSYAFDTMHFRRMGSPEEYGF
jgi:hypothetical protein